jgi:hypothetical protein
LTLQGAIRARDVRAADLQEETTKRGEKGADFSDTIVSSDPTKTAAPGEHRSERSEQLDRASVASGAIKKWTNPRAYNAHLQRTPRKGLGKAEACWPGGQLRRSRVRVLAVD